MDLSFALTDVRDYSVPQRDGTVLTQKRATFFLGNYGPFVEYFPADGFNDAALRPRVDALRRELEAMHR